nr:GNAT family N-acetyltransferase [Pseudomonadota bacterium]
VFASADARRRALRVGALRESDANRFYARHGFELVEHAEWDNHYRRPARS